MSNAVSFVTVTNLGEKPVVLFPRQSDHLGKPIEGLKLRPGEPSRPLPFDLFTHARNWKSLTAKGILEVHEVAFKPCFVRVENNLERPLALELEPVAGTGATAEKKAPQIELKPHETSHLLCRTRIRQDLEELARVGAITLDPASSIGPSVTPSALGSFGSDDVYACYKCGGPIVFRTNGRRHPVHV